MSKYIPGLHREQARLRYQRNPQKYRDRKRHEHENKLTAEELAKLQEKRAKHAEYMRQFYASHPGYKAAADVKHRSKYLTNIRERDRYRNMQPERKAAKLENSRRRRAADPGKFKQYAREYYQKNKAKWVERGKKRTARPAEVKRMEHRKSLLKYRHGITPEQYDAMLAEQGGVCAICGEPPVIGFNKRLHVDHDHKTGKRRGLLCMHCNHSIERVDKFPDWPEKARAYLARPR